MEKLSTIIIRDMIENFGRKEAAYLLKEILENNWDDLTPDEQELLVAEIEKTKGAKND